jgi:peptidoglycan hydrolase CwlO-like protein
MPESIGIMSRWAWLTICAILLIWTAALGYLLLDEQDRLRTAQDELAVAREDASQTAAQRDDLREAVSTLSSQLSESRKKSNLTKAEVTKLRDVINDLKSELAEARKFQGRLQEANAQAAQLSEALKTADTELKEERRRVDALENDLRRATNSEIWRLLSERTVALDKATAYRQALEKDLAKAKAEIDDLNAELDQLEAEASD